MTQTLNHLFVSATDRFKNNVAIKYKTSNTWKTVRWNEYFDIAIKLFGHFKNANIKKGDSVAIICNTRPEWGYLDRALQGMGAIPVPIYPSNSDEDIEYILNNCGAKIFVCENKSFLNKWLKIAKNCPSVQQILLIDNAEHSAENVVGWEEALETGTTNFEANKEQFTQLCLSTQLDDISTIIYTSGTTGKPKGVVLCYKQAQSQVEDIFDLMNVDLNDTSLCFLPFAHILGRVESWGSVYAGYTLAFAESIERIKYNLVDIKPTFMVAVPRIFEKIYNGIFAQAESHPIKKKLFHWATKVGTEYSHLKANKKPIPLKLLAQYLSAKNLVFSKITEKLGGKMRFAVSGGAPLAAEIAHFFHAAGLMVCEGYGLTETTAGVTFNTPLNYKFGSVGQPYGDVKLKIANDGEILIKSDKVMAEYYKNTEATDEVMLDGYFASGDIGHIDDEGFLVITDRKKDLIKTAGGKYVAPQKLENLLKLNKYISNCLIHGDTKKYIVALITLDQLNVENYATENSISYASFSTLVKHDKVSALIKDAIADVNSKLASYESIKNFHVLDHDFTVEDGHLTPSLKVKRKHCDGLYQDHIGKLYGADSSAL